MLARTAVVRHPKSLFGVIMITPKVWRRLLKRDVHAHSETLYAAFTGVDVIETSARVTSDVEFLAPKSG